MTDPGSTPTLLDGFLKDNYDSEEIARLVNEEHPFLDMLDTNKRGTGRRWIVPFIDGNPQGHASTVAGAQTAAETSMTGSVISGDDWQIPWGDYSDHVDIGHKAMLMTRNDAGAFFEDKKEEVDGLYRGFADVMERYMLHDQGKTLTVGGFTDSTGVETLNDITEIVNFEKGMLVQASANTGNSTSDSLLGSGSIGYVFKVNYNAGTFTVATSAANAIAGTAGTPSGWTGTMFAFRNTDFGGTSTPNVILAGYGACNPSTDPGATAFQGIDRSIDIVRRSGVRLTSAQVSGLGLEDRIKKLCTAMGYLGKPAKKVMLHDLNWLGLANSLEGRGLRSLDDGVKVGRFSFPALKLATPRGMVDIFANRFMPPDTIYAFDPAGISVATLGGFPEVINGDGLEMLRKAAANVYEYRLYCAPGYIHRKPPMTGRCPAVVPS